MFQHIRPLRKTRKKLTNVCVFERVITECVSERVRRDLKMGEEQQRSLAGIYRVAAKLRQVFVLPACTYHLSSHLYPLPTHY